MEPSAIADTASSVEAGMPGATPGPSSLLAGVAEGCVGTLAGGGALAGVSGVTAASGAAHAPSEQTKVRIAASAFMTDVMRHAPCQHTCADG